MTEAKNLTKVFGDKAAVNHGATLPVPHRPTSGRSRRESRRAWWISIGLALLGLIPGLARLLVALAGDPEAAAATDSGASPLPGIVHAVSGTLFVVLGAFQFPTARRRARGTWHRRIGRLLVPLGLTAAASALWLTLFYPDLHDSGALLTGFRLAFATAMAASILAGFAAISRRDISRHRQWMIRAYALGLGAATQVFTLGFGGALVGEGELRTALLTGAGWVINIAIAEWVIRRRHRYHPSTHRPGAASRPTQYARSTTTREGTPRELTNRNAE